MLDLSLVNIIRQIYVIRGSYHIIRSSDVN